MLEIIAILIVGLLFAGFATQNNLPTDITLASLHLSSVPLYIVVLGSILIGVLLSAVIHVVSAISNMFTIFNKDAKIKQNEKTLADLNTHIRELEDENLRLREEAHSQTEPRRSNIKIAEGV